MIQYGVAALGILRGLTLEQMDEIGKALWGYPAPSSPREAIAFFDAAASQLGFTGPAPIAAAARRGC